jgi:hypothetical protein
MNYNIVNVIIVYNKRKIMSQDISQLKESYLELKNEINGLKKIDNPKERFGIIFGMFKRYYELPENSEKILELSKRYDEKNFEFQKRRDKIVSESIDVFNKLSKKVQGIIDEEIKNIETKKIKNKKAKEDKIKFILERQGDVKEAIDGIYTGPAPLFIYEEIKQFVLTLLKQKNFKTVASGYSDELPSRLVEEFEYDLYHFERDTVNEPVESWVNLKRFLDKDTEFIKDNKDILFQGLLNHYDIHAVELLYKNKFADETDNDKFVYVLENLFLDLERIHFTSYNNNKSNKMDKKKVFIEISKTKYAKKYEILINNDIRFPVDDMREDSAEMYGTFYKLVENQGYKNFKEKYSGFVKNINNNSYLSRRLKELKLANKILKEKNGDAIIESNFILKIR